MEKPKSIEKFILMKMEKPKSIEKFVVIKRYSDYRVKHFIVYRGEYETYVDILGKIHQELKRRKIRNIGEFIICALHRDFVYIKEFSEIPKGKQQFWWFDGERILKLPFSVFRIINKEMERWIKYDR